MLVGVLRLRREGGYNFSFGSILWKQVRFSQFPLSVVPPK